MNVSPQVDDPKIAPVLSLVVLQERQPGLVLFGVRRPTATSARHPDVLSSPTMRLPREIMNCALAAENIDSSAIRHGEILALPGRTLHRFGVGLSMASLVSYLTEHLMSRKLGVAAALVNGQIRGTACIGGIAFDTVHDSESEPQDEVTLMLSITVRVTVGEHLFPEQTESYSRLAWVPAAQVHDAVRTHDPLQLIPDADPLSVCLHGLCVRSAAEVISAMSVHDSQRPPSREVVA